jgi:hypothetical protein
MCAKEEERVLVGKEEISLNPGRGVAHFPQKRESWGFLK